MPKHIGNVNQKDRNRQRGPILWVTGLPIPRGASEYVSNPSSSSITGGVGNTDLASQLYELLSARVQVHSVRILPSKSKKHSRGLVRDAEVELAGMRDAQMVLQLKPWYAPSQDVPLSIELCPSDRTMRIEITRKLDKVDKLTWSNGSFNNLDWVASNNGAWAQGLVRTLVERFTTNFTIPAESEQPLLGAKVKNVVARVNFTCDSFEDTLVVYSNLRDLDLSTGIKLVWPKPKNSFVASALKNLRLPTRPLGTTPTPDPTVPPAIMSASSISHEKAQGVQDLTGESKSQDTDTATSSSLEVFPYDTLNVISEAGWFKTLRPSGLNRSSFPLQNREEPRERVRSLTPPYVGGAGDNSSVLQRIEQGQEGQESRTSSDWGVSNSHVQFWQSRRLEVIQPNAYFGSVCPQSVPVQPPPYTPSQSNVPSKTNQARVARTIWVGLSGTKPGFGTEDLLAFFEPCGTIEEVFLPTLAIPPYALVAFDDVLGAQHALSWSGSHFRGTRMQIKPKAITTLRTQSTYGAASPSWRGPVPSTRKSPPTARPMGLQSVPYDALRALTPATLPRPKRQNNSFDTYDSPLSIRHVRSISIPARQLNSVPSTPGHKSGKSSEALMPASSSVTDLLPGALYMSSSASEAYRIKFPPNTSTPRAQSPDRVGAGPSSDQGTLTQRVDSGMGIVLWPGGPSIQARADSEQPQVSETNAVSPGWSLLGTSKLATQGFGTTQTIVPGPPPPPPPFFTGGLDLAPAETSSGSSAEYLSIPSTSDRSFSPGLVVHHDGSTEVASTSPLPDPGPTTSDSGTQEHSTSSGSKDGSVTQVNDLSSSNSANVSRSSDEGPEATESLTKGSNSTSSSGDKKAVLAEPSLPPISEALRVLPWDDDPRQPTGLFQEPPNFGPTVQRPPDFSRVQQPPKFSPIQQPPNLSSLIQQPYSLPSQPQEGTAYATPLLPPPMLYLPPGMGMMPGYPSPSGYPPPGTPFAPIFGPQGVTALHVSPYGLPYAPSSPLPMTSGGPYPYAALPPQYGPPSPMMMPPHMASPGPVPFPNSPYAYPSPYLHPSGSPSDDGPSG